MALFTQNMLELAIEISANDPAYEEMAFKFVEHFLYIAAGMNRPGEHRMWDEQDGFYYDLLRLPDGSAERLIFALVSEQRLRRILSKMLDENEFLSPYGIRALSKYHEQHPFVFHADGQEYRVDYLPAESNSGMFGGNSNWRGPIWMPVNVMLMRALLNYYGFYGDSFKIECPTGSGKVMNLFEVANEIADRLSRIFLRDEHGQRPVYGGTEKFQTDPHWKDLVLFYEYFHGDNGAGLGASHQTGRTGCVAALIALFGILDGKRVLEGGRAAVFARTKGQGTGEGTGAGKGTVTQ